MDDGLLKQVLRPLRDGQVCLPKEFRRRLGIERDTLLLLTLKEDKIEIMPVDAKSVGEGRWAPELYAMLKLSGQGDRSTKESEIDALIEQALNEVWSEDCK